MEYNYSNTINANNLRFTEKKLVEFLLESEDHAVVKVVPIKRPRKTKKYVLNYKFYVFINDEPQGVMSEDIYRKMVRACSCRVSYELVE